MELTDALKEFTDIVITVSRGVDRINEAQNLLSAQIRQLQLDKENSTPVEVSPVKESYATVRDLEEAMPSMPIGREVVVEDLDVFTLYSGDEYVTVVYPDFIDIGVAFEEAASLRMSKFIKSTQHWHKNDPSTAYGSPPTSTAK